MEPADVGDRVGTCIEAALTATAFQLLCAEALPKVSYLTQLDIFLMALFVLIFLACVESVCVYRLASYGEAAEAIASSIDNWCLALSVLFSFAALAQFLRAGRPNAADLDDDGVISIEEAAQWTWGRASTPRPKQD